MSGVIRNVVHFNCPDGTSNIKSDEYIKINSCGYTKNWTYGKKTYRQNGRKDYQLLYIKKGSMSFNGKAVSQGKIYLYRPGEIQNYTPDCENTDVIWVHFTGKVADILFGNSDYNVITFRDIDKYEKFILDAISKGKNPDITQYEIMSIEGRLVNIIADIAQEMLKPKVKIDTRIESVMKYIAINAEKKHSNEEYSQMCYMSKNYFVRRFTQLVGTSPQQYRTNILLERSLSLILDTDMRIGEIAASLGFGDELYFSRLFKKKYGKSPKQYKKQVVL